MYLSAPTVRVAQCDFVNNRIEAVSSFAYGGGLHVASGTEINIANCTFVGNEAEAGSGWGGALYLGSTASVVNSLFAGNLAGPDTGSLGGAVLGEENLVVVNCTVVNNESWFVGGVVAKGELVVSNSIAVDNTDDFGGLPAQLHSEVTNGLEIHYSNVEDITGGFTDHNLDVTPGFVNASGNDFRLDASSPLVNKGDDDRIADDLADLNENTNTSEPVPWALSPIPAPVDRLICIVDMGAYERELPECVADLNDDGCVGGADLAILLGAWCVEEDCDECPASPADLNCDGCIGGADISVILGFWGNCPGEDGCPGLEEEEFRGGGGCATPQAAAEMFGFETVEEFSGWLSTLDFETMSDLLSELFCQ